jgi:hypothetical protein
MSLMASRHTTFRVRLGLGTPKETWNATIYACKTPVPFFTEVSWKVSAANRVVERGPPLILEKKNP